RQLLGNLRHSLASLQGLWILRGIWHGLLFDRAVYGATWNAANSVGAPPQWQRKGIYGLLAQFIRRAGECINRRFEGGALNARPALRGVMGVQFKPAERTR